ncbi:hypothetical protein [Desulfosporosinus nitroreducens]|uniref:hypothetical protein n=1 Tax=Desulfosporosinus nitroreducens TaxID=2018668 RepID=UPI00207CD434|nr:hypothetical protein [Desulfosporosinus nitroreducens]MCO1599751.1 hypothetical protein [Desulfosporosinus nitroreducens]
MSTDILITPPGGQQHRVKAFDTCQTTLSTTDKAGSFSLELPAFDNSLIDAFPVGSDVQINQDDNLFRGWVISPPKTMNGKLKNVSLQGSTYTSRTQKIIVTESYTNTAVSDIVIDLFTKYVPWATRVNIQSCPKSVTIRFGDNYLWDAMEQLCLIAAYDWYIDDNLDVNFFKGSTRVNPLVLSQANRNFKKGTANFTPDASKLVNKLWVKGGKATSDPFTQTIIVNGKTPISLFYTPRAPGGESVTVVIGGVIKTVGIQNIDKSGTKHFLLNASEKLLIPDLCTSGTGSITYRYEYPIKILLEDQESRAKYGLFEDVLKVETDDKILAKEQGMQHLARYSNPVITGSIQPMKGYYRPGELIKIEIPDLKINEYMQIREIACESLAGLGTVNRTLQLSSRERDAVSILKDMNNRLAKLEKTTFNDDDGPVEKYVYFGDSIKTPGLVDDGLSWSLHQYHICGQTMCSAGVIM